MWAEIEPMEAKAAPTLPEGEGWWFEPKWDGFRCLVFRDGDAVRLQAKSGKGLNRYFPEVVADMLALRAPRFVLDSELLGGPEGAPSFEMLQMRLHPAESRVRKLAAAQPARIVAFDLLMDETGADLRPLPLADRRAALDAFARSGPKAARFALSPGTTDRAEATRWLADRRNEGVVAKRLDQPYRAGERAMIKVKRVRTADCVVGGFRYAAGKAVVGSLLLGLYDEAGRLNHVGFTSAIPAGERKALTARLEALRGEGFTGDKPGGPSRWSNERSAEWVPLRPELVVEVSFDHVTAGRFRHGTRLIRYRPDKAPNQCKMEQIA